ncbi:MAG TPA: Uma2 family endonuclease [Polyangiaceae bacterium]|nr:Uma2 family endonuclease [Polyangiaceae bacterium]
MSGSEMPRPEPESVTIGRLKYLRAPQALHFPEHEQVPETKWHLELKTLVYQFLKLAFADQALIGCDQFVYFDAANPRVCLAPAAFVRLGGPDEMFGSWKVWERGAPHLAVEIISDFDARDRNWDAKLASYRQLGVRELVRFDPEAEQGKLRIWDRLDDDLVERELTGAPTPSSVLPGYWLLVGDEKLGPTLRLGRNEAGSDLYVTSDERMHELEAELERRSV